MSNLSCFARGMVITYSSENMKQSSKTFMDFATCQCGIPIFLFKVCSEFLTIKMTEISKFNNIRKRTKIWIIKDGKYR